MRTLVIVSMFAATLLTATATLSFGQNAGDQEKGSTGWGGGSKDQVTQNQNNGSAGNPMVNGKPVVVHDQAEAKDQTPIATGEDLKGPAVQLAPSKTPE
jgi:hypothetical protein